ATAFVGTGFECPPRSLVVGVPAEIKRQLSDKEVAWKTQGTLEYQQLAKRCQASLQRTEALSEVEAGRRRMKSADYKFKP
ncbi:MAG: phenylacetic acid degradation protein PaaY, partial [Xanthomonadales bacterium]|nr:phenylacetic acid degradation protein PaaY [Xanthomonadales bacterium]